VSSTRWNLFDTGKHEQSGRAADTLLTAAWKYVIAAQMEPLAAEKFVLDLMEMLSDVGATDTDPETILALKLVRRFGQNHKFIMSWRPAFWPENAPKTGKPKRHRK
jgi:hypothetical protein